MKEFLGIVSGIAAVTAFLIAWREGGYRKGRRAGYGQGFQEGFAAARDYAAVPDKPADPHLDWWLKAEHEVKRTRQTIQDEERWP